MTLACSINNRAHVKLVEGTCLLWDALRFQAGTLTWTGQWVETLRVPSRNTRVNNLSEAYFRLEAPAKNAVSADLLFTSEVKRC
jgi:hypothetical protein